MGGKIDTDNNTNSVEWPDDTPEQKSRKKIVNHVASEVQKLTDKRELTFLEQQLLELELYKEIYDNGIETKKYNDASTACNLALNIVIKRSRDSDMEIKNQEIIWKFKKNSIPGESAE